MNCGREMKGLCFKCNEKYGSGHKCKRLFKIEATEEDEDGDIMEEEALQKQFPNMTLEDKSL